MYNIDIRGQRYSFTSEQAQQAIALLSFHAHNGTSTAVINGTRRTIAPLIANNRMPRI